MSVVQSALVIPFFYFVQAHSLVGTELLPDIPSRVPISQSVVQLVHQDKRIGFHVQRTISFPGYCYPVFVQYEL